MPQIFLCLNVSTHTLEWKYMEILSRILQRQVLSKKIYLCFYMYDYFTCMYVLHCACLVLVLSRTRLDELRKINTSMWFLRLMGYPSILCYCLYDELIKVFSTCLIYVLLCSVKTIQLNETISTLEHEILVA